MSKSWKFQVEAPVETPDGAGGFVRSWENLGWVWGELSRQTGRGGDRSAGRREGHDVLLTLKDAQGIGLKTGYRLVAASRNYRVAAIADIRGSYADIWVKSELTNEL